MQWITNSLVVYVIAGLLVLSVVIAEETTGTDVKIEHTSSSTNPSNQSKNDTKYSEGDEATTTKTIAEQEESHAASETTNVPVDSNKITVTNQASSEYATESGLQNTSSSESLVTTEETSDSSNMKKEYLESEKSTAVPVSDASSATTSGSSPTTSNTNSLLPEESSNRTTEHEYEKPEKDNCTSCGDSTALSSTETTTLETKSAGERTNSTEDTSSSSSNTTYKVDESDNITSTESSGDEDKQSKSKRSTRYHGNVTSVENNDDSLQSAHALSKSPLKSKEYEPLNLNLDTNNSRSSNDESKNIDTDRNANISKAGPKESGTSVSPVNGPHPDQSTISSHEKDSSDGSQEESKAHMSDTETSIHNINQKDSDTTATYLIDVTESPVNRSRGERSPDDQQDEINKLKMLPHSEEAITSKTGDALSAAESSEIYHSIPYSLESMTNSGIETKTIDLKPTASVAELKRPHTATVENNNEEIFPVIESGTSSASLAKVNQVGNAGKREELSLTEVSSMSPKNIQKETSSSQQQQPTMAEAKVNNGEKDSTKPETPTNPTPVESSSHNPSKNLRTESMLDKAVLSDSVTHSVMSVNVTKVPSQGESAIGSADDIMLNDSPVDLTTTTIQNVGETTFLKSTEEKTETRHSKQTDSNNHSSSHEMMKPEYQLHSTSPKVNSTSEQATFVLHKGTATQTSTQESGVQNKKDETKPVTPTHMGNKEESVSHSHQTQAPAVLLKETSKDSSTEKPTENKVNLEQNSSSSDMIPVPSQVPVSGNTDTKNTLETTKSDSNIKLVSSTGTQVPENITVEVAELSNASTPIPSPTTETTTRKSFGIRKPKLKSNGEGGVESMFALRRPTTTTTKRPSTSGVTAPVSIFGRSRTRRPSITSSTTHRAFVRPPTARPAYHGPIRIVGTETFSFSLPPTTLPPTTTEAEEEEEEEEDIVELQEDPSVSYDQNETYSDDDDLILLIFSASTVVEKGIRWKKQLHSRPSPEYKKQELRMHRTLERIFRSSPLGPNLWKIKIDGFIEKYPGSRSVEVDYFVYLVKTDEPFETAQLVRAFNEQLINNTFSRYTFNPAYTQFQVLREEKLNKPTEAPEVEPPIPQWAIAVIVVGTASFIFIILFAAVTMYGRHHMNRRYSSKLDDDLERSDDSRDWERKLGASGAYENLAADVVYDAEDSLGETGKRKYVPPNPPRNPRMKHYDSWRTEWTEPPKRARVPVNHILF